MMISTMSRPSNDGLALDEELVVVDVSFVMIVSPPMAFDFSQIVLSYAYSGDSLRNDVDCARCPSGSDGSA
jgi:hypothetical protein